MWVSFAQAGEGDGVGVVSLVSESAGYGLPTPAPQPGATHQRVSCHLQDLLIGISVQAHLKALPLQNKRQRQQQDDAPPRRYPSFDRGGTPQPQSVLRNGPSMMDQQERAQLLRTP